MSSAVTRLHIQCVHGWWEREQEGERTQLSARVTLFGLMPSQMSENPQDPSTHSLYICYSRKHILAHIVTFTRADEDTSAASGLAGGLVANKPKVASAHAAGAAKPGESTFLWVCVRVCVHTKMPHAYRAVNAKHACL
eukprot:1158977-Pelagomonas_calceolata.AAC.13